MKAGRCWRVDVMRDAAEPNEYYGRTIRFAVIDDERLRLGFTDGAEIDIWDADQTCCEYRHMTTDDDPQSLVGGVLTRIETKARTARTATATRLCSLKCAPTKVSSPS